MRCRVLGILCVSLSTSACILPKDEHASVSVGTTVASKYVHRGQTLVNQPVVQPKLKVSVPTVDGGSQTFTEAISYQWNAGSGSFSTDSTGGPVDVFGNTPPLYTDPTHPLIQKLGECGAKPVGAPWFCDACFFAERGMPAIALGPGTIMQAHTKDEHIAVADLEKGVEFFVKFLAKL